MHKRFNVDRLAKHPSCKQYKFFLKQVKDIPGDIVECGFGCGFTCAIFINILKEFGITKNIWEFDSFEGFPEPHKNDKGAIFPSKGFMNKSHKVDRWLELEEANTLIDNVCKGHKYPRDKVKLIPGFYQETLPHMYTGDKISLLHIDCDLYESYKYSLKLYDKVVEGGIIIFDDYQTEKVRRVIWPGANIAVNEFVRAKGLTIEDDNKKYYVRKKV
jgi:hypothetical protein